jgi:hypothetical protein
LLGIGYVEFSEALAGTFYVIIHAEFGRDQKNILFGLLSVKIANLGVDVLNREKLPTNDETKDQPRQAAYWKDNCQDQKFSIDFAHLHSSQQPHLKTAVNSTVSQLHNRKSISDVPGDQIEG